MSSFTKTSDALVVPATSITLTSDALIIAPKSFTISSDATIETAVINEMTLSFTSDARCEYANLPYDPSACQIAARAVATTGTDKRLECTTPLLPDPDNLVSGHCRAPQGGTKTVGVPRYTLVVRNPDSGRDFLPGS